MPATNKQKLKLLLLLRMLQDETDSVQGLTMSDILSKLAEEGIAAERKSIYRDIQALRDFGYDIQVLQTQPVEYALVRQELDLPEVTMLIDAVQSSAFITERKSAQLVRSLKGLASERERKMLDKRVHVKGRIKSQGESVLPNVDAIHDAMQQKRKVSFQYATYDTKLNRVAQGDGTRYEETPVQLVFADGRYYLVAFSDERDDFVAYRVDRMEALEVSQEKAVRNERITAFDPAGFTDAALDMPGGEHMLATLRVPAELVDAVVDRFGADVDLASSTKAHADVRVPVLAGSRFFGWLAGFDGRISVKSPKRLAEAYASWAKDLAAGLQ